MISRQVELFPKLLPYLRHFALLSEGEAVRRPRQAWSTPEALGPGRLDSIVSHLVDFSLLLGSEA